MISAAELAQLRTSEASAFTSSASVLRKTQVRDRTGGLIDTYVAVGSYPCSFGKYPVRPLERENQPRIQTLSQWTFVFATDVDIRDTDRLVVGTRTFEVVDGAIGGADVVRSVLAMEIT